MTRSSRDNLRLSPPGARNAIPLPVWSRGGSPRCSAMSVCWPLGTGNAGNSAVRSHRIRSKYATPPEPVATGPKNYSKMAPPQVANARTRLLTGTSCHSCGCSSLSEKPVEALNSRLCNIDFDPAISDGPALDIADQAAAPENPADLAVARPADAVFDLEHLGV